MSLYHYTACGLDNVWLEDGYTIIRSPYGKAVSVRDVDGLHQLLALRLAEKQGRLTGKEFRFLRVQLGLTQSGIGKLLDVSENAVSLWERKDSAPAVYDHWLRILVTAKLNGSQTVRSAVERIQTLDKLVHQRLVVKEAGGRRSVEIRPATRAMRQLTPSDA